MLESRVLRWGDMVTLFRLKRVAERNVDQLLTSQVTKSYLLGIRRLTENWLTWSKSAVFLYLCRKTFAIADPIQRINFKPKRGFLPLGNFCLIISWKAAHESWGDLVIFSHKLSQNVPSKKVFWTWSWIFSIKMFADFVRSRCSSSSVRSDVSRITYLNYNGMCALSSHSLSTRPPPSSILRWNAIF